MSVENIGCEAFGLEPGSLPCDATPLEAVSMGLAAGGLALFFSAYLMKKVGASNY